MVVLGWGIVFDERGIPVGFRSVYSLNSKPETCASRLPCQRLDFGCRVSLPIGSILNLRTTTLHRVQRFRGGLVFEAHRLCASLNSGLEGKETREVPSLRCRVARCDEGSRFMVRGSGCGVFRSRSVHSSLKGHVMVRGLGIRVHVLGVGV